MMNWKELWMTLFGTTKWFGLNIGFWVAMAVVLLIVIIHETKSRRKRVL